MDQDDITRIICTGQDKATFASDMKIAELARTGAPHRCYICKRAEGSESIALLPEREETPISTPKLRFDIIEREVAGLVFEFPVCHECEILMGNSVDLSDLLASLN